MNNYLCFGKVAVAAASLKWEELWITVHGFWLEVTKKMGQPGLYVLPLHLSGLSAAFQESVVPSRSSSPGRAGEFFW